MQGISNFCSFKAKHLLTLLFYSKYDYNKDGEVDLLDVKQLFRIYMVTTDRETEEFVSKHDINNDGVVDLLDIKQFFRLYMTGYFS